MSLSGSVKFFNQEKGYGFISGGDGQDVFVHMSAVNGQPLQEGDNVSYDTEWNEQKQKSAAVNVSGGTGQEGGGKGFGGGKGKGKSYGGGYDNGGYGGGNGGGYGGY